jgi:hypothetical protein
MRKLLPFLAILLLVTFSAQADWMNVAAFPDTVDGWAPDAYSQGTAVDGEGKIWYTPYYASETVPYDTSGDGVPDTTTSVRAIYVFNPDGSQADFSPISVFEYDGASDTLWNSARGLQVDPDGNIIHSNYDRLIKFSPAGVALAVMYPYGEGVSLTSTAFDADGNMFISTVLPGYVSKAFDTDWELIDDIIPAEMHTAYARTCEVAPDASAFYYCGFTAGYGYLRFNSDSDVYGDYTTSIDSLFPGMAVEAAEWQPETGYLWGGNTGDNGPGYTSAAWYGMDPATDTFVDSMIVPGVADFNGKPRGIGFSADGMTAYVSYFNSWDTEAMYRLEKSPDGVWEHTGTFAIGYELKAAYPNPFNPSTNLTFEMQADGVADLRIYDLRGAEVAVINNSHLDAGQHTFTFDASDLAAGVYVARLTVNGVILTQNVTLLK